MKKITKVGKAMASVALVAGLLVGGAGMAMYNQANPITLIEPQPYPVEKVVTHTEYVDVPVEVIKEVPVEKLVNVTVEDTTFKVMACDRLLYDDLSECVEEVSAEDTALKLALNYIEEEFTHDIANDLEDDGIVDDERDVELVKVYSDYEDIEVIDSDFDNDEYEFKVKIKYKDNHDKRYVYATLSVNDGVVELKDLEE